MYGDVSYGRMGLYDPVPSYAMSQHITLAKLSFEISATLVSSLECDNWIVSQDHL